MASQPSEPSASTAGDSNINPPGQAPNSQHPASTQHPQQQTTPAPAPSYDALPSPLSTTTASVAHHGLQVLQAASSASPLSPTTQDLAQQYAQSAAETMALGGTQFALHPPNPAQHASIANTPSNQKVTRLRRACDMCSQRKVKCDESGPPCKPCSDLQVDCTFRREMKRRGPPNKHAEAAKRLRAESGRETMSAVSPNATEAMVPMTASNGGTVNMDAESIAPWPVLQLLVDDFFTYIHPLMPFPHEPTFRQAFTNRMDRVNNEFLALLASMIGVLVASFPRSARAHLKVQQSTGVFPTTFTLIDHCRSIALEARGSRFMIKQEMSVDDAATSYFLGLAAAYTMQWRPCKRFMAETMTFCRELGAHRHKNAPSLESSLADIGAGSASKPTDHIRDQISKRIFWVMVSGVRSMTQIGASISEIPLAPPTTQEPYPEMPLEVDDEYIFADRVLQQPEGTISLLTGFNRNIRVFMTMNELIGVDMCYGINFFDWMAQKNILSNGLEAAKQAAEDLPVELQVKVEPDQQDGSGVDNASWYYCPPAFPDAQPANDVRRTLAEQPLRRRQLQCEIQKANIYCSQLATRSYFVERYLNLRDAHRSQAGIQNGDDTPDERDMMVTNERELIVRNLLTVLASISQRNMEPSGQSLINKIRQVASTLLNDAPERKGPVAIKAEQYLYRFLEILTQLEKNGAGLGGSGAGTLTPQLEDEEIRHWANLRDYQMQFMANGGSLGSL
ncbi:hypothetical protein F4780DRAFT_727267 [Xylariomycetidae sp. FL0641]|nr:hypothetical protein F4780DRAFT_727267 [Xylariomycetidae sp. FL0641]